MAQPLPTPPLVAGPLRKELFFFIYFSPKIVEKFLLSKSVSSYFKTKKKVPMATKGKTIQKTPFQQHTIFSNTEMVVFFFSFCIFFLQDYFFIQLKNSLFCMLNIIPYYCIYRNVLPQNLNLLLTLGVARWIFAVWFHSTKPS